MLEGKKIVRGKHVTDFIYDNVFETFLPSWRDRRLDSGLFEDIDIMNEIKRSILETSHKFNTVKNTKFLYQEK